MTSEAGTVAYDAAGLITAVAQDAATGAVLMVAHMNREALERTLATGEAWYWSRSRRRLWRKGEESGHTQRVRAVGIDCDGDAVLLVVDQTGAACHTGHRTCFYRAAAHAPGGGVVILDAAPPAQGAGPESPDAREDEGPAAPAVKVPPVPAPAGDRLVPPRDASPAGPEILCEVSAVLAERRRHPRRESYSARLFGDGLARLNEKVMEEAAEVTRAARKETPDRLVEETADLWFHSLALLVFQGVDPAEVFAALARRRR